MTGTVTRGWTNRPGELLIEPCDVLRQADVLDAAVEASGLSSADFVTSKVVTAAIPEYTFERLQAERAWPDVEPEALANPLFWLSELVAARYVADDGEVEPDDLYAARVALSMEASGMFDTDTGEWLDVLAAVGVDVGTVEGRDRVARWQAGAPDDALDAIDLTEALAEVLERDEGTWLLPTAAGAAEQLIPVAGLYSAQVLRERLGTASGGEVEPAVVVGVLLSVARSAFDHLNGEPEWWAALEAEFTASPDVSTGPGSVIGRALERLAWIEETHLPLESAIIQAAADVPDVQPASLSW